MFNLYDKKDMLARSLPHGDRKLLDIALAYALNPELLLLDEPTSGVATYEKYQIMETLVSVIKKEERTAVIVEHDMDIVFKYSDRIIAMADGKVIGSGKPVEVRSQKEVIEKVIGAYA
jgi:branched-chain amino acid transport system ATP-binding protein